MERQTLPATSRRPEVPFADGSPFERIPNEVLGNIFRHYIGERVLLPPNSSSSPWKLGQVSPHWREVMWSTSEIWRDVKIETRRDNQPPLTTRYFFDDILRHSQTKLSLMVKNHISTPVLDLALPYIHRFRSLTLFAISYATFTSLLELPAQSLPSLEYLQLSILHTPVYSILGIGLTPFRAAPNLTHVDLTLKITIEPAIDFIDSTDPELYLPSLPWSQLTHLTLASFDIPWTSTHKFLPHCRTLLSCHLTIRHVSNVGANPSPSSILLQDLRDLQLKQLGNVEWDKFLQPFRLPLLRTLGIDHASIPNYHRLPTRSILSPDAITALVLRSGCLLETLSIGRPDRGCDVIPVTFQDLDTLLRACPDLKVLKGTLLIQPSIFVALRNGHICLPKLSSVTFRVHPDGLMAFNEFMESHFDLSAQCHYTGSIRRAFVLCHTGRGYRLAYESYRKSIWVYLVLKIHVEILGIQVDGEEQEDDLGALDDEGLEDYFDTIIDYHSNYYNTYGEDEGERDDNDEYESQGGTRTRRTDLSGDFSSILYGHYLAWLDS